MKPGERPRCNHCGKKCIVVPAKAELASNDGEETISLEAVKIVHPRPTCFLWDSPFRAWCIL